MMFTEKLKKMVRRQATLVGKEKEGLTPEEKVELDKLNTAILAATQEPAVEKSVTRLTTMNQEEFAKYLEEQTQTATDIASISLLKRNVLAVQAQKAEGKEVFAIELPVEKTDDDKFSDLLGRIASLEAKLDKGSEETPAAGEEDGNEAGDPPPAAPEDSINKSIATELGAEAMDALISRFTKLKEKMDSGTITSADVDVAFDSQWEMRRFIELAAALVTKTAEIQALVEPIVAGLKKLNPELAETTAEGDTEGDTEGEVNKGDEVVSWEADLAKGITPGPDKEYQTLKDAASNRTFGND